MRWIEIGVMAAWLCVLAGCKESSTETRYVAQAPEPEPEPDPTPLDLGADGSTPDGMVSYLPIDPGWVTQLNLVPTVFRGVFRSAYWWVSEPLMLRVEADWLYFDSNAEFYAVISHSRARHLATSGRAILLAGDTIFEDHGAPTYGSLGGIDWDRTDWSWSEYTVRTFIPPAVLIEDVSSPSDSVSAVQMTWRNEYSSESGGSGTRTWQGTVELVTRVVMRHLSVKVGDRFYTDCVVLSVELRGTDVDQALPAESLTLAPGVGLIQWTVDLPGDSETGRASYGFELMSAGWGTP